MPGLECPIEGGAHPKAPANSQLAAAMGAGRRTLVSRVSSWPARRAWASVSGWRVRV